MCEKIQYSACLKKDIIIKQGFTCNKGFHIILKGKVGVFYLKTNKLQYQQRKNNKDSKKVNFTHLKTKMIRAIHQSARFSGRKDIQIYQNLNSSCFFNNQQDQKEISFSQQYINDLIRPFQKHSDFTDIIKIIKILQNNYNLNDKLIDAVEQHILDENKKLASSTIKLLENKFGDLITEKQQGDCFGENFLGQGIRNATVISLQNSEFLVLTDIKYIQIISQAFKKQTQQKIEIFQKALRLTQQDVNIKSVQDKILNFQKILFRRNQLFIKQGQKLGNLYIVIKGSFLFYKQQTQKENDDFTQKQFKQNQRKILISKIGKLEIIGGEQFLGYFNSFYQVKAIEENTEVYKVPMSIFEIFTNTTMNNIKKIFQQKFQFQTNREFLQNSFKNQYTNRSIITRKRIQSLIVAKQQISQECLEKMRNHTKFLEFFKMKSKILNQKINRKNSHSDVLQKIKKEKEKEQLEQNNKKIMQQHQRKLSAKRFLNKQKSFINRIRSRRFASLDVLNSQKNFSLKIFDKFQTKLRGRRVILKKIMKNIQQSDINLNSEINQQLIFQ